MKSKLAVLLSGVLFGAGLTISGMTNPAKVTGFLDFFGAWDPSLALVMVGAIGVHSLTRRLIARRPAPVFTPVFETRPPVRIDAPLVIGSAIFGAGWGLGGYCPGPAFVSAGNGSGSAALFALAMTAGMFIHRFPHRSSLAQAPINGGCDAG